MKGIGKVQKNHIQLLIVSAALLLTSCFIYAQQYECPDLAVNGKVDFADFAVLAGNWYKTGSSLPGDLDDNGSVDINDLEQLCDWWLEDCPTTSTTTTAATTTTTTTAGQQITHLFAGTRPAAVYKYLGGTSWEKITPEEGWGSDDGEERAVLCLCKYNGELYAGTRWVDNSQPPFCTDKGRVWKYHGGTNWELVGDNLSVQVSSLAVYNDILYAGTADYLSASTGAKLYEYQGGNTWALDVNTSDPQFGYWGDFRSLHVWNGILHIGQRADGYPHGGDQFGRYDGTVFTEGDQFDDGFGIWDFEAYDNKLYASGSIGYIYRSYDGINWARIAELEYTDEYGNPLGMEYSWELEKFQDYLYISHGEYLKTIDGSHVWYHPNYHVIISMTATADTLYFGTGREAVCGSAGNPEADDVYAYDGTGEPQLISVPGDLGGNGVQVLLYTTVFIDN